MIYIFSHWTEAFPCGQATATTVAKILLENVVSTWETPLKLHTDWGIHFRSQVIPQVCAVWLVSQHFHYAYHLQSSGLIESTNSINPSNTLSKVTATSPSKSQVYPFWNS